MAVKERFQAQCRFCSKNLEGDTVPEALRKVAQHEGGCDKRTNQPRFTLSWDKLVIVECPGCGATRTIQPAMIITHCECGLIFVNTCRNQGWYLSREAFERGDAPIEVPR